MAFRGARGKIIVDRSSGRPGYFELLEIRSCLKELTCELERNAAGVAEEVLGTYCPDNRSHQQQYKEPMPPIDNDESSVSLREAVVDQHRAQHKTEPAQPRDDKAALYRMRAQMREERRQCPSYDQVSQKQ